jgi:hypothetical protein
MVTAKDGASPEQPKSPLRFAGFILDFGACLLTRVNGEAVQLTRSEFALLRFLTHLQHLQRPRMG